MTVSDHAVDRWCQRFPGEDLFAAFARARPVAFWQLRMEARRTGRPFRFGGDARHLRDDDTGAVFILRPDPRGGERVVTVVRFSKPKTCRPPAVPPRGRKQR